MGQLVDQDARRAALAQVLESHTFSRSEQMRRFLRYVCEKEICGEAGEIKESLIGIEVFKRPQNYSTAGDSSVRSRAWELRQKLEEFYSNEMPNAPVRITLPKGSYVPVFLEQSAETVEMAPARDVVEPGRRPMILAFAAGFLVCAAGVGVWRFNVGTSNRLPPVLMEAWGPLVQSNANVLVCVASGLHMVVRPEPFNEASSKPSYPAPKEIYPLFRQHRPLSPDAELWMRPSDSNISVEDANAVVIAATTLKTAGASFQILPERAAPLAAFRGRNVVLFGIPQNSNAVDQQLKRAILTIAYNAGKQGMVIRDRRKPDSQPPAYYRKGRSKDGPSSVYGLITVLPTEGAPGGQRTVIISGVSSVGSHGAMEFFSSAESMNALRARFVRQGFSGFPPAYQVVVECRSDDTLLLSTAYAGHEVLSVKN